MAFINAACFVFAIAGYRNDEQMVQVGTANQNASAAANLVGMADHDQRLAAIVAATRANCETGGLLLDRKSRQSIAIRIYGRFNNNGVDVSPMHYWIECNDYILEKWTDHALVHEQATLATRAQPQSLAAVDQATYSVGHCDSHLTIYQARNILEANAELHGLLGLPVMLRGG